MSTCNRTFIPTYLLKREPNLFLLSLAPSQSTFCTYSYNATAFITTTATTFALASFVYICACIVFMWVLAMALVNRTLRTTTRPKPGKTKVYLSSFFFQFSAHRAAIHHQHSVLHTIMLPASCSFKCFG